MTIYQGTVKSRIGAASECRNIHHYDFGALVASYSDLQQATDHILARYAAQLQASFHTSVEYYGMDWRRVDVPNMPTTEQSPTGGSWFGTNTGDLMPTQNCVILRWSAPTAFPRTCRTYISGFVEGHNDADGTPAATLIGVCNTLAHDLHTFSINAGINTLYKVSVTYGGTPRAVTAYNPVSDLDTNNAWYIQRRRRPGVGI